MSRSNIKISDLINIVWVLIIALAYYWVARLGFIFAWQHTNVSAIWPPSALAFIAIFVLGYRVWPGVWLGAFLANASYYWVNPSFNLGQVILFSALIAIGNTSEALINCFLVRKLIGDRNPLYKPPDILKFMAVIILGCMVSAFTGSVTAVLSHPAFWNTYSIIVFTWWLGDFSGVLIIVPIFWALTSRVFLQWNFRMVAEFVGSLSVLIFANGLIFSGKFFLGQEHIPITYLSLPLVVWLTYRFEYWGGITSVLCTLLEAVQGTRQGFGPFITDDANTSLLLLQTFIATLSGTSLLLAAALHERRQVQQEVILREQRFRALVENSLDMIALVNPLGVISYSSPSVTKVMGYPIEEHVGRSIFEFIHPEDEPRVLLEFARVLNHPHQIVTTETRIRHRNGSWRWVEGTGQNLLMDPAIGNIVINYRDITERKLAEEVLKNELKQATRLADIGTLAAIVAHELRTPLGVIQMASHNLKHQYSELSENKHLENIQKKVWEGNRIIDNLLSYSRIKMPAFAPCKIVSLLEECIVNVQSQFKDAQIDLHKKYQLDGNFEIEVDADQIREVLLNILNNAYQASSKNGRIELDVKKQDEEYVQIDMKDHGVGIDPDDMDKIFRPFFTTKAKGTGLGLSICNEIINLHHGRLEIQSTKGQGTAVQILLPIQKK